LAGRWFRMPSKGFFPPVTVLGTKPPLGIQEKRKKTGGHEGAEKEKKNIGVRESVGPLDIQNSGGGGAKVKTGKPGGTAENRRYGGNRGENRNKKQSEENLFREVTREPGAVVTVLQINTNNRKARKKWCGVSQTSNVRRRFPARNPTKDRRRKPLGGGERVT